MNLKRNIRDRNAVRSLFDDAAAKSVALCDAALADANRLPDLVTIALKAAKTGSVIGLSSAQVFRYLRLATQANTALFAAVYDPPAVVNLGDKPVSLSAAPDESYLHVTRWSLAVFSALLCRDHACLGVLAGIPSDVLRASSTQFAEYGYLFADALRAFLLGADDTGKLLVRALGATDPDKYPVSDRDAALYLDFPIIQTFCYAVTSDERFGPALTDAVHDHKRFWRRPNKANKYKSYLAVELLGVAALAHDRDLSFDLSSEYVPKSLVRGEGLEDE